MPEPNTFQFRHFSIRQQYSPAKVGTDGILLGAWTAVGNATRILDVGTGTGLIALMLAQRCPEAYVDAIELHPAAADEAALNFRESPWPDRLRLIRGDASTLTKLDTAPYDLIVSNPPFFRGTAKSDERQSWRHQQTLATDDLFQLARHNLHAGGRLVFILPKTSLATGPKNLATTGFYCTRLTEISSLPAKAPHRCLWEFTYLPAISDPPPLQKAHLTIQTGGSNEYSAAYISLTRDFYPWMP